MRTRNCILAAAAVIGLGATLLIFRDQQVSSPNSIPSRAPKQESGVEAVAKPLHIDHLDNDRAKRAHPLDNVQARGAGQIHTSERWAPFGEVSAEEETASLQHANVTPAAEKLPFGAIENIVADLENELQEKGGLYGYNSRHYGANMEAGWVEFATNHQFRIGAPTLSYALEDIKVGDQIIARGGAAEPQTKADARVVVYARGNVDEEYALRPEAMEQTFVVKELPALRGAITVTGVVGSNLTGPAEGTKGEKLAFSYKGNEIITISGAVAIDAAGSKEPLELAWSDGRVTMTVPADWVASAQLPIRIDPLVGSPFSVFTTTDPNTNYTVGNAWPVRMVDAAYSPTNATWFVVWTQRWGTGGTNGFDYDVRAQRVTATGTLVGGVVGIDTSTAGAYEPCISYSAGSSFDRYLIAWRHDPSNNLSDSDQRIQGKIHGGDGVFITLNSFTIEDPMGQDMAPTAAFDGTNWYVSYTNKVSSSNYDIRGRFVSTAGTPGTSATPDNATGDSAYMSSVSFANGVYMIAWNKGTTSSAAVSARTMLPAGTFPTPITTVEPNTNAPREVDISGGGTQFLMVWRNNSNQSISGRIANASTGATITFPTSTFTIQTPSASGRSTPRAAYSTTSSAWYTLWADAATNGTDIYGAKVSSAGVVSAVDQISSDASWEWRPELAWNSATNEMLLVYNFGSGSPSFALKGQRFSMGTTAPPAAPTGLAAAPGNAQAALTWTASTGATTYNVKRGTASGGPYPTVFSGIASTSYTDVGLTNGTTYYYVVTAQNSGGESGISNQASATPVAPPAAPTGLAAAAGNTQAVLAWTASAGATTYNVKRGTTPGGPYPTVFSGVTTTSYTNTGLTNGTTYYYIVTAQNAGGESGNSNQASVTPVAPPSAPTTLTATPGNAQIALSWTASAGAATYNVKQGTTPGGPYPTVFGGITTTTFTSTGLTNGTTYYYIVTAQNAGGESGNSNQASATPVVPPPPPPAPTGLAATPGNTQATLTWTASSGATTYNVKRGTTSGGPYPTVFSGITLTSFTNTGLTNGTTYYYVVTAQNAGGESGNSNQASALPVGPPPAPTSLAAAPGNAQVVLTWTAAAGATTYNVKQGTSPGGPYPTVFSGIATTSYTNTGLTNGTTYYYIVTAQNSGGESGNSNQASATPVLPAPPAPTGLAASPGNGQATLTWTSAAGATTYNVKRGTTPGGPYPTVFNGIATTSFTDTGLTNGTTYYYVVTAQNAGGESGASNESSVTSGTTPAPPTALTALPGNSQSTLSWTASPGGGLVGYNAYRSLSSTGPFTAKLNSSLITTTTYLDNGLTNGTTYYYVVRAANSSGLESSNSNTATSSLPNQSPLAPTGIMAVSGNTQIVVTWNASSGATGYNVKRGHFQGDTFVTVGPNVASSPFSDLGLTNGSTYYYAVSALNAFGESPNSDAVASSTPLPVLTGLTANAGIGQVTLTWNSSPLAQTYAVFRSSDGGTTWVMLTSAVTLTSYIDLGVTNGTTYLYEVSVVYTVGVTDTVGPPSNSVSATPSLTSPAAPSNLSAQGLNSLVALRWNPSVSATSYSISRSTNGGGTWNALATTTDVSYNDRAVSNGTSYSYEVSAVVSTLTSSPSNIATATPSLIAPAAPTDLNAQANKGGIILTWNASLGATSYSVQRSTDGGSTFNTIASVTNTLYTDGAVSPASSYVYRVIGIASDSSGSQSSPPSATASVVATAALVSPSGLVATGLNTQVLLVWSSAVGATSYNIYGSTVSGGPYRLVGSVPQSPFTDTAVTNGQVQFYVVTSASDGDESNTSSEVSATPNASSGPFSALFIVGNTTLGIGDTAIQSRLSNLGFSVVVKSDVAAQATDATGKSVILFSPTVNPSNAATLGARFSGVALPLVNASPDMMGTLGLTGSTSGSDFGTVLGQTALMLVSQNATHPLSAGLAGSPTVLTTSDSFTFGQPNFGAISIATTTDQSASLIFAFDVGFRMGAIEAPARRVGFFLSTTTAANLNSNGGSLFDATVRWAAGVPSVPIAPAVSGGNNQVTISWDQAGDALSYNVLRATSLGGPWTTIATGISSTNFVDTGASNGTTYLYAIVAVSNGGISASSLVTAFTPSASFAVGAVAGPPYLRALLDPQEPAWSRGTFTAVVRKYAQGAFQSVPDSDILAIGAFVNGTPSLASMSTSGPRNMTLDASTKTPNVDALLTYAPSIAAVQSNPKVNFKVQIAKRYAFQVNVRYVDVPFIGITDRKDENGNTNKFFDPLPDRRTYRNNYATYLQKKVVPIWQQAAIDLYFTADPSDPKLLTMTGVDPDLKAFVYSSDVRPDGSYVLSADGLALAKQSQEGAINLYLVKKLAYDSGGALFTANHGYFSALRSTTGKYKLTVVVDDQADEVSIAHEIGHALSLDHPTAADLIGSQNDLSEVYGVNDALSFLLMTQLAPSTPARFKTPPNPQELDKINLITTAQANKARYFGRWKAGIMFPDRTDQ